MDIMKAVEAKIKPLERPIEFKIGDTVRVHYRIVEGDKERIQVFEGIVIAINNKGVSKTFTVRKISFDIGVERIFPVFSPRIAKIEVIRRGRVRRAKLYYLRERTGKSAKVKERRNTGKTTSAQIQSPAPEPMQTAPVAPTPQTEEAAPAPSAEAAQPASE